MILQREKQRIETTILNPDSYECKKSNTIQKTKQLYRLEQAEESNKY